MTRVAVFGRRELHDAVGALGLDAGDDGVVAVIDAEDLEAVARAAALASTVPRVVVAPAEKHTMLRALGTDPSRIVTSSAPAVLGPALGALLPSRARGATRVVAVTGTRGGVGRTLLVANLARRLAESCRVAVVDATGTGAAAWWLGAEASPWAELEPLVAELSAEHLAIVAREAATNIHLVGGGYASPSDAIVVASVRAALSSFELVLVDMPPVFHQLCVTLRPLLDRAIVLTYDDPLSVASLDAPTITTGDWVIASQFAARRVGEHDVFRALPRDEPAVASALSSRRAVAGRLGHAYDDLAEILTIDAAR